MGTVKKNKYLLIVYTLMLTVVCICAALSAYYLVQAPWLIILLVLFDGLTLVLAGVYVGKIYTLR